MDEQNIFTPYDEAMQTKELQILKTILPYVDSNIQRQLSMLIQFIQIRNAGNISLTASEINPAIDKKTAMLSEIKKFCTPKEQETIDTLLNIMCVMDNYEFMLK